MRSPVDDAELVRRYRAGESMRTLAAALGIARDTVYRHLASAGVPPRSPAEASAQRYRHMSPAERQAFTAAARTAAVGKKHTEEHLARTARAREIRAAGRTPCTTAMLLTRALQARGLTVRHWRAVGRYTADLVVGGVVVEMLGRGRTRKRGGDRLRYLMDRGFTVLYVWMDERRTVPLATAGVLYVARMVDTVRRRPGLTPTFAVLNHDGTVVTYGVRANADFDLVPRPGTRTQAG